MLGRPRNFDADTAVDRFIEVFWKNGFGGTSIDDLQASIGVKRGSFYAAFGDKENAYLLALERYVDTVTSTRLSTLADAAGSRAGLAAFLRAAGEFISDNTGRGCLLLTAIAQPPAVRDATASAIKRLSDSLISRISAAAQAVTDSGEVRANETADAFTAFVVSMVLGLNAMARSGESAKAIQAAAETAAAFLEISPALLAIPSPSR